MQWHTREHRPDKEGVEILLAFQCVGSEHHPTHANRFIRWEYEVIEARDLDSTHDLEVGWPATEATHWAYIPTPNK